MMGMMRRLSQTISEAFTFGGDDNKDKQEDDKQAEGISQHLNIKLHFFNFIFEYFNIYYFLLQTEKYVFGIITFFICNVKMMVFKKMEM